MWIDIGDGWFASEYPGEFRISVSTPRSGDPGKNYDLYPEDEWHDIDCTAFGVPSNAKAVFVHDRQRISKGSESGGEQTQSGVRMVGSTIDPDQEGVPWMWKARADGGELGTREEGGGVWIPLVNGVFQYRWKPTWNASSTGGAHGGFDLTISAYKL